MNYGITLLKKDAKMQIFNKPKWNTRRKWRDYRQRGTIGRLTKIIAKINKKVNEIQISM